MFILSELNLWLTLFKAFLIKRRTKQAEEEGKARGGGCLTGTQLVDVVT